MTVPYYSSCEIIFSVSAIFFDIGNIFHFFPYELCNMVELRIFVIVQCICHVCHCDLFDHILPILSVQKK
jgi:hypothetical protein